MRNTLVNIRLSINRHLQLPPYNKTWDLMKVSEFKSANKVFGGK